MTLDETDNLPRFLTLDEAAKLLGVTKRTLTRYSKQLENPFPIIYLSDRIARVPWDQFNLWIDSKIDLKGGEQ